MVNRFLLVRKDAAIGNVERSGNYATRGEALKAARTKNKAKAIRQAMRRHTCKPAKGEK